MKTYALLIVGIVAALMLAQPKRTPSATSEVVRPAVVPFVPAADPVAPAVAETCRCGGPGNCTCDPEKCACKNCLLHRHTSYAAVVAASKATGKPYILIVHTDPCPWCKVLDKTLAGVDLSAFAVANINLSDPVCSQLGVRTAPAIVVAGADQQWRTTLVGAQPIEMIRAALATAFAAPPMFMPARPLQVSYAAPMRSASC